MRLEMFKRRYYNMCRGQTKMTSLSATKPTKEISMIISCSKESCSNQLYCRGVCYKHYYQKKASGELKPIIHKKDQFCTVDNCSRKQQAKALCHTHYELKRRNGTTERVIKICKADDCLKVVIKNEYCALHLDRLKRNGHLRSRLEPRECLIDGDVVSIPLTNDGVIYTLISIKDIRLTQYNWSLSQKGEQAYAINRKLGKLHHSIVGKPPRGLVTDHKNRNKLDNRRENLRFVTYSQNVINSDRIDKMRSHEFVRVRDSLGRFA